MISYTSTSTYCTCTIHCIQYKCAIQLSIFNELIILRSHFALNVNAAINVSQLVVERMLKAGVHGAIVSMGSIAGTRSISCAPALLYSASKAALESLTRCLALELSPNRVCVVLTAHSQSTFPAPRRLPFH